MVYLGLNSEYNHDFTSDTLHAGQFARPAGYDYCGRIPRCGSKRALSCATEATVRYRWMVRSTCEYYFLSTLYVTYSA